MSMSFFRREPTVKIDGQDTPFGICQRCGMRGALRAATQITPADANSITGDVADEVRSKLVCVTCFDTPPGLHSSNETHKKLPPHEYLMKSQ